MNENQRGEEGGKYYYSHYEGQLNVDENGKNYTSDDETIDAAIDKIKNWKDEKQPLCMFLGLFIHIHHIRSRSHISQPLIGVNYQIGLDLRIA